jgi:hypothetical protein
MSEIAREILAYFIIAAVLIGMAALTAYKGK